MSTHTAANRGEAGSERDRQTSTGSHPPTMSISFFLLNTCSKGKILDMLSEVNHSPKINHTCFYFLLMWLLENSELGMCGPCGASSGQ